MRGSKSYIADETEMATREEVRQEVTDFYIHSLGFVQFICCIFCLPHGRAPHLHVTSPNICSRKKRKHNQEMHISNTLRIRTLLNHSVSGEAAGEHSDP